jgi:hypothetical protein
MEAVAVDELHAEVERARCGTFLERELAATQLAGAGTAGLAALAAIVADVACSVDARVTALRHLGAIPEAREAVRTALRDPAPVLRLVALEWIERTAVHALLPDVRTLVDDDGRVHDLDEEHVVGEIARRVAASLSAG